MSGLSLLRGVIFAFRKAIQPVDIEFVPLLLSCLKKSCLKSITQSDRIDPKNARSKAFNPRKSEPGTLSGACLTHNFFDIYPPASYLS